MAFFRPLQDFDKPNLGEEYYHAVVVDNNDPDKLKRVKIRIEELHGTSSEIPDSELPWAIQFRPTFLGGDTDLSSSYVPRIGSNVIVTHIRGEIYQPAYMFELSHNTNRVAKGEESYPDSYVFRDSDDNYYHVDMVNDTLDIKFNGSETLQITVDRTSNIDNDDSRVVGNNDSEYISGDQYNRVFQDQTNIVNGNQDNTVEGNKTETIIGTVNQTVISDRTQSSNRLVINTTADIDINAAANVTIDGSNVILNGGSGGGVVVSSAINHATGVPHGDASGTVTADY